MKGVPPGFTPLELSAREKAGPLKKKKRSARNKRIAVPNRFLLPSFPTRAGKDGTKKLSTKEPVIEKSLLSRGILAIVFLASLLLATPSGKATAFADELPDIFGEYIPGAVPGSNSPYSFGQGWGGGVDWNVFVTGSFFVRGGVQVVNFVAPGIFLLPVTVGGGYRFTEGSPGDFYGVADVGVVPSFYPGGSSTQSYYDIGVGYSFTRVFAEFKLAIIPGTNYGNGTFLYFPLTLGVHL
jgi:hypothetical protein